MKTISYAILSSFVAVVLAQDPTPQTSGLIPKGISTTCSTFLASLDNASDISKCLSNLVTATGAFNPKATTTPSADALSSALASICTSGCDEAKIRTHLADFYTACKTDLVGDSANKNVITLYDIFYILAPLRTAICSKDSATNKYCIQEIQVVDKSTGTGKGLPEKAAPELDTASYIPATKEQVDTAGEAWQLAPGDIHFGIFKRQDNQDPFTVLPDTAAYRASSLPYLFISPELPASQLCTKCTSAVLSAYVKFESATPYAMGINQSPILGDQLAMWKNVTEKCGNDYTSTIMSLAGLQGTTDGASNVAGLSAATRRSEVGAFGAVAGLVLVGAMAVLSAF